MTIVVSIIAVCACVALPKLGGALQRSELRTASNRVKQDIQLLRQYCRQQSVNVLVTVIEDSSELQLEPSLPEILGNASGQVSYKAICSDCVFTSVNLDGTNSLRINHCGELLGASGGQLGVARIAISNSQQQQNFSLSDVAFAN
jgi:Tfp pilus assembly protein FimT